MEPVDLVQGMLTGGLHQWPGCGGWSPTLDEAVIRRAMLSF